jgi:hypothetical protein
MTPLAAWRRLWFRYSLARAIQRAAVLDSMGRHPAGKGKL